MIDQELAGIEAQAREWAKKWAAAVHAETEIQEPDHDGDNPTKHIFVGTVFALCPSGKYYMPWAAGNLEACPKCRGKGCDYCGSTGSREAWLDEVWRDTIDQELSTLDCWMEGGEGDPCDLFVGCNAEEGEDNADD